MSVPVFNYNLLEFIEKGINSDSRHDFSYQGICLFIQDNYEEIKEIMEGE